TFPYFHLFFLNIYVCVLCPLSAGLAWVATAEVKIRIIEAAQGQNVSLPCTAGSKKGVDYWACRWYKVWEDPRLTGLVSRTPPGGMLKWYVGADTRVSLEYPSLSLLLPTVKCSDSGVYQCYMAAPVGEQNREGRVELRVLGKNINNRKFMLDVLEIPDRMDGEYMD
uniref:Ig-like domain-containing protein n=1 Tax=Neogobius melanostomus TaxID=47308 RepID=A0A8C6T798_9GOBI